MYVQVWFLDALVPSTASRSDLELLRCRNLTFFCVGPRPASDFNAQHPGASFNFSVGWPNAGPPSRSGELAHRRLAIPESHPRSFDEILAETSHTIIGCEAGFVEQRLGCLARTDRFQVSECIHDELQSAGLIHERLRSEEHTSELQSLRHL